MAGQTLESGRWNTHHVLYQATTWCAQRETATLRELPGLLIPMDVVVHQALHQEVPYVPVFSNIFAGRLLRVLKVPLQSKLDPVANVTLLAETIEKRIETHSTDWVTEELGVIGLKTIRAQIPYIKEGYIPPDKHIKGRRYLI